MSYNVRVENDRIITELITNISNIPNDEAMMIELHELYEGYMKPYVPMDEGILMGHVNILPDGVYYLEDYAHYMFEGVVYGPNIPIFENGVIVGFWSRPNKQPTGAPITYSTEKHSLATHHWNEAMLKDKEKEFVSDVKTIIRDTLDKKGL